MALRPLPLLALAGLLMSSGPAAAFPDAKVEAQITPKFGALLSPPISRPRHRHGGWKYAGPKPWLGKPPLLQPTLSIDCGSPKAGPYPVNHALSRLQPGGVLYIRGASACRETVEVWRPVTIVGEGASAFDPAPAARPSIVAPAGQPCLAIAPGVRRVEIRGLRLVAERGGREACVDAPDAEVALVDSEIIYTGEDSAVFLGGGRLILKDSRIEAPEAYAGVLVQGGALTAERSDIVSGSLGLDLELAPGSSTLTDVRVTGPGLDSGRRSAGLLLRGGRDAGRLSVQGGMIEGWNTGLWFDIGASAEVSAIAVRRTRLGVIVDGGDVSVVGSRIGARDSAAYVAGGRAFIDGNILYGYLGQAIVVAPGAQFSGRNRYYPRLGCVGDALRQDCLPMGRLQPDLRDDDNGWGPPPAWDNPKPPRGRR